MAISKIIHSNFTGADIVNGFRLNLKVLYSNLNGVDLSSMIVDSIKKQCSGYKKVRKKDEF